MRLRNKVIGVAFLMTTAACRGGAQAPTADSAYHPLTLPVGPVLRCRAVDSAHVTTLTLSLGHAPTTPERSITATFDSSGRALTLTDWLTERSPAGAARLDAFAVRFASDAIVLGFHGTDSALAGRSVERPTATKLPLTPDQQASARRLTTWLWAHRCMRRPTPP
jgi:hypothetical protein